MNAGDTGFMLTCAALVFFMTPGLAFFYGGLVRRKNVVNTMMAIVMIMGLAVVMWALFGFSLAFGGNHGGIIGDFRWFGLEGVGWGTGPYSDSIPNLVFCAFQMMFAIIISSVDSVANKVGIQCFEDCFTRKNFCSHSSRVSHTRTSDRKSVV